MLRPKKPAPGAGAGSGGAWEVPVAPPPKRLSDLTDAELEKQAAAMQQQQPPPPQRRTLSAMSDAELEAQASKMQRRSLADMTEEQLERQAAAMQGGRSFAETTSDELEVREGVRRSGLADMTDAELERRAAAMAEQQASPSVPAGIRAQKVPEMKESIYRRAQEERRQWGGAHSEWGEQPAAAWAEQPGWGGPGQTAAVARPTKEQPAVRALAPPIKVAPAQRRGTALANGGADGNKAPPGSGTSSSSCSFGLMGDTQWFARPRAWLPNQGVAWGPQHHFQRLAAATEKLTQAHNDPAAALRVFAAYLGSDVVDPMMVNLPQALFAEAARLVFGVVGFTCEGTYPAVLRGRALSRAAQTATWPGVAPQALLGQWFNLPALLALIGAAPVRAAFDAAGKRFRAQFVCGLSRAAFLEVGQQEVRQGRLLRLAWSKVTESFPEIALVRALCGHVRRRCWEDVRDRSRSRSRSRERKKKLEQGLQSSIPPDCIRFFVKGTGRLAEVHLETHFAKFGTVLEVTILYDKKTQKSRGLAFVTLKPEGFYRGKKNTKDDIREWVLTVTHIVGGLTLEVSEASEKPPEDEEKKHEERVEERRRQRLEREQRLAASRVIAPAAAAAGAAVEAEERCLLSPWAKRWRAELAVRLPKDVEGPAQWTNPRVSEVCCQLWAEIVEHARRTGSAEVQDALAFFAADHTDGEGIEWSYIPAPDMLLIVADGIVGITSEGVFTSTATSEAIAPPSGFDQASLKTVQPAVVAAPTVSSPATAFTNDQTRLQRGGSDREKVFVGGLTPSTTLEMLMGYFATYGKITDAVVMMDKATGKPRGFGFVVFEHISMVDAVLRDYSIHRLDGKWVEVKRATPQEAPVGQGQIVPPPGGAPGAGQVPPASPASPPAARVQAVPAPPEPVLPTVRDLSPPTAMRQPFAEVPPPSFAPVHPPSFAQVPPPHFAQVPPPSDRRSASPEASLVVAPADKYDPLAG